MNGYEYGRGAVGYFALMPLFHVSTTPCVRCCCVFFFFIFRVHSGCFGEWIYYVAFLFSSKSSALASSTSSLFVRKIQMHHTSFLAMLLYCRLRSHRCRHRAQRLNINFVSAPCALHSENSVSRRLGVGIQPPKYRSVHWVSFLWASLVIRGWHRCPIRIDKA